MTDETTQHDHFIDACGLVCPEPLMIVRNKVREMSGGETLFVAATDPSTDRDFRDFCRFMGHELVSKNQTDERLEYLIRKGVPGGIPSRTPAEGSSPARGGPSRSPG